VSKRSGLYPSPAVDTAGSNVVSQAGGVLLTETIRAVGLDKKLSGALAHWRHPNAVHDPAKVVLDLAVTLAMGGDCLADIAVLRAEPDVYGPVGSDPTVSRAIARLADDPAAALRAINTARAAARARAWELAGEHAPDHDIDAGQPLIIDVDATLVTAHSDKEGAAPTFKKGFGHHPLWSFVDHGPTGTGEPLSVQLRPGNAGSNTAADHITVLREALRQLPDHRPGTRPGRKILIRIDSAGCTHELLNWIVAQRLSYSVGFTLPDHIVTELDLVPEQAWQPAYDADGEPRHGAWVLEVTGLLDLSGWPPGMRVTRPQGAPTPRRATAAHRRRRPPAHRVRHQHPTRRARPPTRRPGTTPPPPSTRRGPHPMRERHRPGQPAPTRTGPEPDLVRHRRAGLRAHRLGTAARPRRPPGPPLGTQATTAAAVLPARAPGPHRTPHRPTPTPPRTLGSAPPASDHQPAGPDRAWLTPNPPAPTTPTPAVEPAPTRATSGALSYPPCTITTRRPLPSGLDQRQSGDERSGLASPQQRRSTRCLCSPIRRSATTAKRGGPTRGFGQPQRHPILSPGTRMPE
jgi:hypothetical protein